MRNRLQRDSSLEPVQAHITDPTKCLGSKLANTILKVRPTAADAAAIAAGTTVDVSGWASIALYPSVDGQVEYNGVAAAVEPVFMGQQNLLLIHPSVTQIKLSVACTVCGM